MITRSWTSVPTSCTQRPSVCGTHFYKLSFPVYVDLSHGLGWPPRADSASWRSRCWRQSKAEHPDASAPALRRLNATVSANLVCRVRSQLKMHREYTRQSVRVSMCWFTLCVYSQKLLPARACMIVWSKLVSNGFLLYKGCQGGCRSLFLFSDLCQW